MKIETFYFEKKELPSPKIKKFQEETFGARKIKKHPFKNFLMFQEMELSSHKLKKLLYFSKKLAIPEKQKVRLHF